MSAAVLVATAFPTLPFAPTIPSRSSFSYPLNHTAELVLGKRSREPTDEGESPRAKARRGSSSTLLLNLPPPASAPLSELWQPEPAESERPPPVTGNLARVPPRQRRRLASASPTSRAALLPVSDSVIDPELLRLSRPASPQITPAHVTTPLPVASSSRLPSPTPAPPAAAHGRCMWASGKYCEHVFEPGCTTDDVAAHLKSAHDLHKAARKERVACEWAFCRCAGSGGRKWQDVHVEPRALAGHIWRKHLGGKVPGKKEPEPVEAEDDVKMEEGPYEPPVDIVTMHGSPAAALAVLLEREAQAAAAARTPSPAPTSDSTSAQPNTDASPGRRRSPRRGTPSAAALASSSA
ncbi:unnamed protein product [Peniophora sp. CBMAI 1063]|nr:unnamed protein product [Peniophora sp. CBMAI 1063]